MSSIGCMVESVVKFAMKTRRKAIRAFDYWFDVWETTPLHFAVQLGDEAEVVRLIEEEHADVDKKNRCGLSSLKIAANCKNKKMLTLLLYYSRDPEKWRSVHSYGIFFKEFVELQIVDVFTDIQLLDFGVYLEYTPLQIILELIPFRIDIIEKLLDEGCNPHVRDGLGNNSLHVIALSDKIYPSEKIYLAKLFLDKGADVNAENKFLNTPLHIAINKEPSLAALLLTTGADIHRKNYLNMTPFDIVILSRKRSLLPLLIKYTLLAQRRGRPTDDKIIRYIETSPKLYTVYKKFEKHLEKLKTEITPSCHMTYYDILMSDVNRVATYLRNEDILKEFQKYVTATNAYENDIFHTYFQALKIKETEDRYFQLVNEASGNILPYPCIKKIFSFFTAEHLNVLKSPEITSSTDGDDDPYFSYVLRWFMYNTDTRLTFEWTDDIIDDMNLTEDIRVYSIQM